MTTPVAPSDPPRRQAKGTTGPFAYTDEGEGPVLLAVHGLPGSVRDYRWLAAALSRSVRLVRLDLPGFGETPLATGPGPGIDARGAFVAAALETLGIERCVLVGHSMGGAVALSAAVQAPARVAALALLASIGLRPHVMFRRLVGRGVLARAVDLPLLRTPTLALLKVAFRATGFPPQTTPAEVAHTMRCVAAVDFEVQRRNTSRLTLPTLTAWAEDDPFIEKSVLEEHAALLPAGPRLSWREGGHNVQKSQAVEIAAALVTLANAQ
ncbi:MAG: alpha/beta hydrolase [Archangium sp.]|nr:alpha/beta hydrolase [Archangium sp.]